MSSQGYVEWSSQMRIYNVPIGSDVRMTKLQDKFWRSTYPTKLGVRMEGPYNIECVQANGNLTILLCEGITKHINICRVLLYCWPFHIPLWRQFLAWIVFVVFTFYFWSFFLHLKFEWVEGGVFMDPFFVCSSIAEWVLPWRGRVSCP